MLTLGHIDYSNCFPVHALLLDRPPPPWLRLYRGVPSELNARLRAGDVDVAPCSSIEYARNSERYRVIPDVTIASDGAVRSIVFETSASTASLGGATVALPTASATSVVLLRILLERRDGVRPRYQWFDQGSGEDPLRQGAAGALWIGDAALWRPASRGRRLDLGLEWKQWTGLPFVFALWQTTVPTARDAELATLHELLSESLDYFYANDVALAARHAHGLGLDATLLLDYWRGLRFRLDDDALRGLTRFYQEACALDEVPLTPPVRWAPGGH
jgi:chorismate dehydratase